MDVFRGKCQMVGMAGETGNGAGTDLYEDFQQLQGMSSYEPWELENDI